MKSGSGASKAKAGGLSVGTKIMGAILLVNLIMVAVSVLSFVQVNGIDAQTTELIGVNYPGVKHALATEAAVMSALSRLRNMYATKNMTEVDKIEADLESAQQAAAGLAKTMMTVEGRKMVKDLQAQLTTFADETRQTIELLQNNQDGMALLNMGGHVQDAEMAIRAQLGRLASRKEKELEGNGARVRRTLDQTRTLLLLSTAVALVLGVGAGAVVTLNITRPLARLVEGMDTVAKGDLTHTIRVKTGDELERAAAAFTRMSEGLKALIGQVAGMAEQVASSSEELSTSAQQVGQVAQQVAQTVNQLAQGANEQAKQAQDAGSVVEKMSSSIQQVTAATQKMAKDAEGAGGTAAQGQQAISQAVGQMDVIRETVGRSAGVVQGLGERSREIGQIVEVITGIADQTNLLALNAAIEAARAGEQGRGFAVVAEEVRKLAEQSREAAERISGLIREIQAETAKAVETMDAGTKEVAAGAEVVAGAGRAFSEITQAVQTVVAQIERVSAATQELAAGSDQVVKAVESIAAITEESAAGSQEVSAASQEASASVEEITASAESLAEIAQELQKAVARFKL
ncbi:MAG TPA: HAMP domain-containing protein [Firmicutes bacterium]|nr:HAMP domain-containing protein [Bacillota bacterium]